MTNFTNDKIGSLFDAEFYKISKLTLKSRKRCYIIQKKPVDVGDVYIDKMVISDPFHFVKKSFFSTIFSRQVFSRLQKQ